MDGACWVCFCCWHSSVQDKNVRIFWVRAMESMCAQTRPRFIFSPKRVLRNGVRTHVNSKRKFLCTGGSEESRTLYAASRRTQSKTLSTELFRPPPYVQVICSAYFGDWLAHIGLRAATLRQTLKIKLAVSCSNRISNKPVPTKAWVVVTVIMSKAMSVGVWWFVHKTWC